MNASRSRATQSTTDQSSSVFAYVGFQAELMRLRDVTAARLTRQKRVANVRRTSIITLLIRNFGMNEVLSCSTDSTSSNRFFEKHSCVDVQTVSPLAVLTFIALFFFMFSLDELETAVLASAATLALAIGFFDKKEGQLPSSCWNRFRMGGMSNRVMQLVVVKEGREK